MTIPIPCCHAPRNSRWTSPTKRPRCHSVLPQAPIPGHFSWPSRTANVPWAGGQSQPGLDLGGSRGVEQDVVDGSPARLVLTERDGRVIYFKDVARIVDTFEDRTSFSRIDGEQSVTLSIKKRTGANIIQVADRVMAINDGKLLAIGKPDEVRENPDVQRAYLGVAE